MYRRILALALLLALVLTGCAQVPPLDEACVAATTARLAVYLRCDGEDRPARRARDLGAGLLRS